MGCFTHTFLAEYTFPPSATLETLKKTLLDGIQEAEKFHPNEYNVIEGDQKNTMFQRRGVQHSVHNVYRNKIPNLEEHTIYVTHTSKRMRFVDDMVFAFVDESTTTTYTGIKIRAFSCSRIGSGDFGQNQRNVEQIMRHMKILYLDRKVYQQ